MTPFKELIVGRLGITLSEANDIIWAHKLNCLPIVDDEQRLHYLVFRKDYDDHNQSRAIDGLQEEAHGWCRNKYMGL